MPRQNEALGCFVISPIGQPGSPENLHADAVFEHVIVPACKLASAGGKPIKPLREDHNLSPADIMKEVVQKIVGWPVVVGVLTFDRPNVYYEIAIAHAAGRPIPMLKRRGEPMHFDIAGKKHIDYLDSELVPLAEGETYAPSSAVVRLAQAIKGAVEMEREVAFNDAKIAPLGGQDPVQRTYPAFRDITPKEWSDFFFRAEKSIALCGYAMNDLGEDNFKLFVGPDNAKISLLDILKLQFARGLEISVTIMHEDNPALRSVIDDPNGASDPERAKELVASIRDKIKRATRQWRRFETLLGKGELGSAGKFSFHKIREGVVHGRLSMTEGEAIWTPYFHQWDLNSHGPAMWMRNVNYPLYSALRDNLAFLQKANAAAPKAKQRSA
jgi:hypothetical protein